MAQLRCEIGNKRSPCSSTRIIQETWKDWINRMRPAPAGKKGGRKKKGTGRPRSCRPVTSPNQSLSQAWMAWFAISSYPTGKGFQPKRINFVLPSACVDVPISRCRCASAAMTVATFAVLFGNNCDKRPHRSISPMTISIEPTIAGISAMRQPSQILPATLRFAKLDERARTRNGTWPFAGLPTT